MEAKGSTLLIKRQAREGRIAKWILAFSLGTERPWVRFSAFPRNFLSENSSLDVAAIY